MVADNELGAHIRGARLKRGLSLSQLASAVGCSVSSVRKWERGEVKPSSSFLAELSAVLMIDFQNGEVTVSDISEDTVSDSEDTVGSIEIVDTVEQPMVEEQGTHHRTSAMPGQLGVPDLASGETRSHPMDLVSNLWGAITSKTSRERVWIGWIRGTLTLAALILMFYILLWAIGELIDTVRAILDSFSIGSSST